MNSFIEFLYNITVFVMLHSFFYCLSFNSRLWFNGGLSSPALVPIQFSNQSGLSELHWVLHLSGASVYLPSPDTLHGGNILAKHNQSQREHTLKIDYKANNKQSIHSHSFVQGTNRHHFFHCASPPGFRGHEDTGAVSSHHLARSAGHEAGRRPAAARLDPSPRLPRPAAPPLQQQHDGLCHGSYRSRRGTSTAARNGSRALPRPSHHHHPQQRGRGRVVGYGHGGWWMGWFWVRHARLQDVA